MNNDERREHMANKLIIRNTLKHYYDEQPSTFVEPDKTKSISELSRAELDGMLSRIRSERELQSLIREMKRNSGERDTYESPFKIDTTTPINQLYHHGIKGMKWGVRRFQNPDGTRTAAGKRRERETPSMSENHDKSRKSKVKGISELSNDELKKLNERLQLEATYKKLTASDVKKGESWVKKSLASASEQALTEFSKGVILGGAKLLVKEISPQFAEAAFKLKDKDKDKN